MELNNETHQLSYKTFVTKIETQHITQISDLRKRIENIEYVQSKNNHNNSNWSWR